MQNDRAFKCSRCGEYEYETELAEKVCKKCARKTIGAIDCLKEALILSSMPMIMKVENGRHGVSYNQCGNKIKEAIGILIGTQKVSST